MGQYLDFGSYSLSTMWLANIATSALLVVILGLFVVLLAHTAAWLGRQTFLYRKRRPVEGWNRRFYPAIMLLLLGLLLMVWALQHFKSTLPT